jgi:hypothetical protein
MKCFTCPLQMSKIDDHGSWYCMTCGTFAGPHDGQVLVPKFADLHRELVAFVEEADCTCQESLPTNDINPPGVVCGRCLLLAKLPKEAAP